MSRDATFPKPESLFHNSLHLTRFFLRQRDGIVVTLSNASDQILTASCEECKSRSRLGLFITHFPLWLPLRDRLHNTVSSVQNLSRRGDRSFCGKPLSIGVRSEHNSSWTSKNEVISSLINSRLSPIKHSSRNCSGLKLRRDAYIPCNVCHSPII
jgi:hypothetical protein